MRSVACLCFTFLALGLAGCGGSQPKAAQAAPSTEPDIGLALPQLVGDFTRIDVIRRDGGNDITAGYAALDMPRVVVATVRVHRVTTDGMVPLLGDDRAADPAASERELRISVAQVRRFYPDATLHDVHAVFLLRNGRLQGGAAATLRYVDLFAGKRQPIDLDITMFCCVDSRWAYEYRVRHPADQDVALTTHAFMQALDWSAPDAGSGG